MAFCSYKRITIFSMNRLSLNSRMDERMRDLPCQRIQMEKISTYVGKKQRQVAREDDRTRLGDMWTFVAIDPNPKFVPAYRIGKRDMPTAKVFMADCPIGWRSACSSHPTRCAPTWTRRKRHLAQT